MAQVDPHLRPRAVLDRGLLLLSEPGDHGRADIRARVVTAALECFGRYGLAKTTIGDVARAAGLSRATLYRTFASKDEVMRETIQVEAARISRRVEARVAALDDIEEVLAVVLHELASELAAHEVLQKVLQTEPELLLPLLTIEAGGVVGGIAAFCGPHLERAAEAGRLSDAGPATADYVARMLLSFAVDPGGEVGSRSVADCRDLVRNEILGALLCPPPNPPLS